MPRKQKAAEPGFNVFQCQLCADKPQFDQPGTFSAHMTDVHQFNMKDKYHKRMDQHLDATEWSETVYTWLNGETVFAIQQIRIPRTGEDAAWWSVE